jgi:hypothetical protein
VIKSHFKGQDMDNIMTKEEFVKKVLEEKKEKLKKKRYQAAQTDADFRSLYVKRRARCKAGCEYR